MLLARQGFQRRLADIRERGVLIMRRSGIGDMHDSMNRLDRIVQEKQYEGGLRVNAELNRLAGQREELETEHRERMRYLENGK